MPSQDDAFVRQQQMRWFNGDAARWVRPDASRFLIPGTRVETIFPALALKYSPNQPRVPAGNSDGGQWTSGSSGRPRVIIDTTGWDDEAFAESGDDVSSVGAGPMGSIDFGDIGSETDSLRLFDIGLRESERGGVQLAGDLPDGLGGPKEEPPKIPGRKPTQTWKTTAVLRAVAEWSARKAVAIEMLIGAYGVESWLRDYKDVIEAARDPAKTLAELQGDLDPKPGYDRLHIVEKTAAQRWGYTKDDTEDPDNLVMIPRLKHYQITGWYASRTEEFNGLSPREYLADKDWAERRETGLKALIRFGVLEP